MGSNQQLRIRQIDPQSRRLRSTLITAADYRLKSSPKIPGCIVEVAQWLRCGDHIPTLNATIIYYLSRPDLPLN